MRSITAMQLAVNQWRNPMQVRILPHELGILNQYLHLWYDVMATCWTVTPVILVRIEVSELGVLSSSMFGTAVAQLGSAENF